MPEAPRRHHDKDPLWAGPSGEGPLGGITQSMISRFLSCRERFRLKFLLGLEPPDKWNHKVGYGNMWHTCEEHFHNWKAALDEHTRKQIKRYPMQMEEIEKWWNVCLVQWPEYVHYWSDHPDVLGRTILLPETCFDVPYQLPSGRTVRLRGKWDSVDLIEATEHTPGGIYLQENKTKGDVDRSRIERQMKFDLQTMMYLVALKEEQNRNTTYKENPPWTTRDFQQSIKGVRYNVIRRPLSGGWGNISPHKQKATTNKFTPKESDEQFYERLRLNYIAKEPEYWFFRVRTEVSSHDLKVFRETCLDPILENICAWYEQVTDTVPLYQSTVPFNWRTPFGVWSALEEDRSTEYDAYLETGSESGLRRVESLFPELKGD